MLSTVFAVWKTLSIDGGLMDITPNATGDCLTVRSGAYSFILPQGFMRNPTLHLLEIG